MAGGHTADDRRLCMGEILRRAANPVQEGLPHSLRLLLVEALRDHTDGEDIARPQCDALTPVRIEEALAVELEKPPEQLPERGIRCRLDRQQRTTEQRRELVGSECEFGDDPKAAASSALDRPEQVGVRTGIGDTHCAVGRDDLGLEEPRRGRAVVFREASKTAALDEPRDADGDAAAALDIAATLCGNRVVNINPYGAGFNTDGRLRGP